MPKIKIIRPGRYTSVEGTSVDFSEADLQDAVAGYDADKDPAPLVIGHPKLDAPAYGWVASVGIEDGHLVATPDPANLEPAFAELIRKGRYRKVSGRFYLPGSAGNPTPGKLHLKHIGFLGAAAPAVKGLGTVSFAEDAEGEAVTIDTDTTQEKKMEKDQQEASFAERTAELDAREARLAEKEAAAETTIATATATARQALHAANVSFAETQVAAGKLAPAGKELVVGLLDELEATGTVSFGEANGDMTPVAAFKKLFDTANPLVSFAEAAKAEDEEERTGEASFAAPTGFTADPSALKIHAKAVELQGKTTGLSYLDAVKQVS